MAEINTELDYSDAVANWFIELGEREITAGNLEKAVRCLQVAARVHARQNRTLWSPRLEENLRRISSRVFGGGPARSSEGYRREAKKVTLHVLSEAFPAGGHTAMAARWIANDRDGHVHNVALLSQRIPVPEKLQKAVSSSGGKVFTTAAHDPVLRKAAWLRELALNTADHVVLHVAVADVICPVAFGTPGGPPVMLVNHAAHTFWTGATIADLVLNCRGSALEQYWTKAFRGVSRCAIVPIPLSEPVSAISESGESEASYRTRVKQALGVPESGVVVITVGSYFKYLPSKGLDFLATCEGILRELPDVYLLSVGFEADDRWQRAAKRVDGRIRPLGSLSQEELAMVHDVADLYIEGFPFGTTTALLEAGLRGVPVVLAPASSPPPYGSDGIALDDILERPLSVEEYSNQIIGLCRMPSERERLGRILQFAIAHHHTGPGWSDYLSRALDALPRQHCIYPYSAQERTPEPLYEYWSEFISRCSRGYGETLEHAVLYALSSGIRPRVTAQLARACKQLEAVRIGGVIPLPVLDALCRMMLAPIPRWLAKAAFSLCTFLFSGGLSFKLVGRVTQRIRGGSGQRRELYADYRKGSNGVLLSAVKSEEVKCVSR